MLDDFFSISILDAVFAVLRHQLQHPDTAVDRCIVQLRDGSSTEANLDYPGALELTRRVGWEVFQVSADRKSDLKVTLMSLAKKMKPLWARASYEGRSKVIAVGHAEIKQCLEFAGLLESPASPECEAWWQELSTYFRDILNAKFSHVGKEGERRSLEHEVQRLRGENIQQQPYMVAGVDDGAGFDIQSYYRKAVEVSELRIEVKACSYSPMTFWLTRNEWRKAQSYNPDYIFHVWDLSANTLRKLAVNEVARHVPQDQNYGEWQNVKITLWD